jgi:hypothetical protein
MNEIRFRAKRLLLSQEATPADIDIDPRLTAEAGRNDFYGLV